MSSLQYLLMTVFAIAFGVFFGLTKHRFFNAVLLLAVALLANSFVWLIIAAKEPLFASPNYLLGAGVAWIYLFIVNVEPAALSFLLCRAIRWLRSRREPPNKSRACCDTGNVSTPFVFCWMKRMHQPFSFDCCTSFQTNF